MRSGEIVWLNCTAIVLLFWIIFFVRKWFKNKTIKVTRGEIISWTCGVIATIIVSPFVVAFGSFFGSMYLIEELCSYIWKCLEDSDSLDKFLSKEVTLKK